jgi:hypothetical protein
MDRKVTRQAIFPTEVYAETAEKHELILSQSRTEAKLRGAYQERGDSRKSKMF